jgi:hypothetical protein
MCLQPQRGDPTIAQGNALGYGWIAPSGLLTCAFIDDDMVIEDDEMRFASEPGLV